MEKLQIALQKARATRLGQRPAAGQDPDGSATAPGSVAEDPGFHNASWDSLPRMTVDPKVLDANRIVAYRSGANTTYYDILRTRLRDEVKRRGFKRIAVTSTRPQAGKSTTLTNLACSFGRMPQSRTMIFDFDMRRPMMAKLLGQMPRGDMGQVLRGELSIGDHFLRYGDNLAFGLNAGAVERSSELLQSERTHDLLNAIEEQYQPDLMLFDMPPFLAADDTQGFLGYIDGVLLIVEAERTTRHQLDTVEQKLSELTTVVGVVLNKCPFPDETDAGAYGYDYY